MAFDTIFTRKKKSRKGLTKFDSYNESFTKADRYDPRSYNILGNVRTNTRIANVKRLGGSKTNGKYKVVGITDVIEGGFDRVKEILRDLHFTGIKMGAVNVKLA